MSSVMSCRRGRLVIQLRMADSITEYCAPQMHSDINLTLSIRRLTVSIVQRSPIRSLHAPAGDGLRSKIGTVSSSVRAAATSGAAVRGFSR